MKKNMKAFTLIELLAVIVILAIIAVIATPIVINIINDSKKKAFENTAYGVIEAAKNQYMQNQLNNKVEDIVVDFSDKQNLEMSGIKPKGGQVISNSNGVSIAVYDGKYCAIKEIDDSKVEIIDYDVATCKIKERGTVTGKVIVNVMQNDIADKMATIQLKSDNKVIASATTNAEGNYTISNVPYGSYEINVSNNKDYYAKYFDYGYKVINPTNTIQDIQIGYGDFNKDGIIADVDFSMIRIGCFNMSTVTRPECSLYDLDKSTNINISDSNLLVNKKNNFKSGGQFSSKNVVSLIISAKYEGKISPSFILTNGSLRDFEPITLENGDKLYKDIPAGLYSIKIKKVRHIVYYNDSLILKEGTYTLNSVLYAGVPSSGEDDGTKITQNDLTRFDTNFPSCENKAISDSTTPVVCKDFDFNEDNAVNTLDRNILSNNIGKTITYAIGFN